MSNKSIERIKALIENIQRYEDSDMEGGGVCHSRDGAYIKLADIQPHIDALMALAAPIQGWHFATPADDVVVATRELSADETSTAVFSSQGAGVPREFAYALALAVAKKEAAK